jgi:hypothetical protein
VLRAFFTIFFGLVAALFARENPFLPAESFEGLEVATNVIEKKESFDQHSTTLPSSARVLKYVVFGYQNLDGSVEEKSLEIDRSIDWHDPIVITKESNILNKPLVLPKDPQKEQLAPKNKDESIKKEVVSTKEEVKLSFEDLILFEVGEKSLKVLTKDRLFRNFLVTNPYKIVLDFKKDTAFYTKEFEVNHGAFKSITMGNHSGYYRAAILLDGHYIYEVKEQDFGYEVLIK